jgi:L-fuculokinase
MDYAVAVLDIGKTNKKVAIYDDAMQPLAVRKRKIGTVEQDGLDIEDVDTVVEWFLEQLKELSSEYPIRSISVTTHGATLVCVDEEGQPSVPPLAYTNDVPDDVHERFWAAVGDRSDAQARTATAEILPLINIGKLLWYSKERWPQEFSRTKHILFYPQYFGYRLTGKSAADITYTGCHSYLWNYEKHDWSDVADILGIRNMLPKKPENPESELGTITDEVAKKTGLDASTKVTLGIHDSNSSLIPYLITQDKDFVLNSTGTWCVAMHPVDKVSFKDDELGKMIFYNLSFEGRPVKTSILMGGQEYEVYTEAVMTHHRRREWPDYDPAMYADILAEPKTFILPTMLPGTGQFPDSIARVIDGEEVYSVDDITSGRRWPKAFEDYRSGFALANLSLAIQTQVALERVGLEPGTEVFIEGGFRQNPNYGALLGALLPENPLYLTALEEATSFGAALCGKAVVDGEPVSGMGRYVKLDKQYVEPAKLEGLQEYVSAWLKNL